NPLRSNGDRMRQGWFGCACGPPNIARLLASLGTYIYSQSNDGLWVHLYIGGAARATLADGTTVTLTQATRYPWDGEVTLTTHLPRPTTFTLSLRIPGWCEGARVAVNGEEISDTTQSGRYLQLDRSWTDGDTVHLSLPMPIQRLEAHPCVTNNLGHVALRRGPVVYCLEEIDHDTNVHAIQLPADAPLTTDFEPGLLHGVCVIRGEARVQKASAWDGRLYRPVQLARTRPVALTAVPYYAWNNRGPGTMTVWIRSH
ncbi:MAG: glycoside hydrolase family 127 protein, partial [Candidatus Latescibacteria bacterium]|nr:glycoside hydrolase family 127 protein [Candidatus Latescibacterota bacterium]